MKKLLFLIVTLLALTALAQAQSTKVVFDNDPEQYVDSCVRILCFNPDKDAAANGIPAKTLDLAGARLTIVPWSAGTGFVINKENGYIVTNNHVVAITPSARQANSVIVVVETITGSDGRKTRVAHKANVMWLSPENDIAVIQVDKLSAKAIPLDTGDVHGEQDTFTMGYPGMSDEIAINADQAELLFEHLKPLLVKIGENDFSQAHNGTKPSDADEKTIVDKADDDARASAKESNFDNCLGEIAEKINPTWGSATTWDITDVLARNPSWLNYFEVTQNDGRIQRLTTGPSFSDDAQITVPLIQYAVNIQHGNSGGPLLSDRGGVIGVVGRATENVHEGDAESANYATQIIQLKNWLDGDPSRHYQKLLYIPRRTMIMVGLGLLVVAFGFVYISVNSRRPGLAHAPVGGGAGSAGAYGVTPPKNGPAKGGDRTIVPGKPGSGWVLAGRAGGRNLNVEFSEGLFSRNGNRLIIGRSPELSHLVLETDDVSRQHAQIRKEGGSFFIADRNSSNRTAVNGQFTGAPFAEVSLREGDTLTLGEAKLEFRRA
jgi:S1-C subfamily serine protease